MNSLKRFLMDTPVFVTASTSKWHDKIIVHGIQMIKSGEK